MALISNTIQFKNVLLINKKIVNEKDQLFTFLLEDNSILIVYGKNTITSEKFKMKNDLLLNSFDISIKKTKNDFNILVSLTNNYTLNYVTNELEINSAIFFVANMLNNLVNEGRLPYKSSVYFVKNIKKENIVEQLNEFLDELYLFLGIKLNCSNNNALDKKNILKEKYRNLLEYIGYKQMSSFEFLVDVLKL